MKEKTYNRIVTSCIWIAIFSALSFELLGHLLAGSIGIMAGLVAIFTYFYNQFHEN